VTIVPIPGWNAQGVIPPINQLDPTSAERAPYSVSLTDLALRFGQTPERREVLDGFLRYRAELHAVGLTQGLQWLNGSFLEDVESLETRPPNDIDVVTYYRLPAGRSQLDLLRQRRDLFPIDRATHLQLKSDYKVDAYLVNLAAVPERLMERSTYWYSLMSHRRNQLWKGYVQIDLAPAEDTTAAAALVTIGNQGAQP